MYLGIELGGGGAVPLQNTAWLAVSAQGAIYVVGYALIGLLLAVLFRNLVVPLVIVLVVGSPLEALLANLISNLEPHYLPFSALGQVIMVEGSLSPWVAAGVFAIYLVVGWLITWFTFLRRDAAST